MKHLISYISLFLIAVFLPLGGKAQDASVSQEDISIVSVSEIFTPAKDTVPMLPQSHSWFKRHNIADHLDVGIDIGSMGVGIEVKTPVTRWAQVRAGVVWMPRFTVPMSFNLNTYSDGIPTGNFNRVAQMLYDMTGITLDEKVNMKGKGSMVNFKFLIDVFPFQKNRHWHFTAGFYLGTSKIATAINTYEEKPTLVGLNIYNRGYEYFTNLESIYSVPYLDPELVEKLQARFRSYGRMGVHIGDFADGKPYIMEPSPDGTVSAKALVNRFKPYIGAGYSTFLDKGRRWNFAVDLGALFWGGEPDVINHDYYTGRDINFTKELHNIRGKVGDYMDIIKALPVYPVLQLSISYSIL